MSKDIIKITAVGDIMLGDLPACYGFGVGSLVKEKGPDYLFSKVTNVLGDSDILFGNLETVLSDSNKNRWWLPTLYMRGAPSTVEALEKSGFKVLSVANNHLMQHGEAAFRDTIENLRNKEIKVLGITGKNGYHCEPVVEQMKSTKLGFLGYSLRPEEYRPDKVLYSNCEKEQIIEDIHRLKKIVDILIVSLHWGDEFIQRPSQKQIVLARKFIDEGVNIIIGHHPHVLQGIETYSGGIIVYSLGNFVSDMWLSETRKSLILEIYLNKKSIKNINIIPLRINDMFQPELVHKKTADASREEIELLGRQLQDRSINEEDYKVELENNFAKFRASTWRYYAANITKYNLFYFFELLLLIVLRRVFRIHI